MKEEGWQAGQLASTLLSHPAYPKPLCILILFYFSAFETGPYYVAHTRFELMVFQPQSPKSWDYKCVSTTVALWPLLRHVTLNHTNSPLPIHRPARSQEHAERPALPMASAASHLHKWSCDPGSLWPPSIFWPCLASVAEPFPINHIVLGVYLFMSQGKLLHSFFFFFF